MSMSGTRLVREAGKTYLLPDVHVWFAAGEGGGEDIFVYLMSMSGPLLVKKVGKTYLCT